MVLLLLPMLAFGVPALLGHPVLPGDDLTQNFPLRVLAGQQIRTGHLPLLDPYIWSGAPLLAGWNAGAAYPLTWLFAVLPATAAWTLNLIAVWAVAGLGMFAFLRALRLTSLASLLGALSFAFAGAMVGQVAHLGLVAGMSWVPVELLAVLRLSEAAGAAARVRWTGVLAAAFGLTILAGEPRAIADAGVIVACYAAWRAARLGRRWLPAAGSAAAGMALGICLGAVQWLPGLAAVATSQRGGGSLALFESGSLYPKWLLLMLVPDLLGGSGSLGQPAFFGPYNLAEVTGYVGVLPLVAAAVLAGRLRLRPRLPEWAVWLALAAGGALLALGGRTPLGSLLVHVPFFGGLRLQSRNIAITDLALAVLLAYWVDQPFSAQDRPRLTPRGNRRPLDRDTISGAVPALAMIAVVVAALAWGSGLLRWLGVSPAAAGLASRLLPWLVPYALLGAAAVAFLIFGRQLAARARSRWLAGIVAADLLVFLVLAAVAVPGPGGGSPVHRSAAARPVAVRPAGGRQAAARPIADLRLRGRFAIYDPGQFDTADLRRLGAPDLNVTTATPSIQGYSAIADSTYASATGSHAAMGEGQDVLSPRAIGDGTLDQLATSALLTLPRYLVTAAAAPGQPAGQQDAGQHTGQRSLAAGRQATWNFGGRLQISALTAADPRASQDAAAGARLGFLSPDGHAHWYPATAAGGRELAVRLPHPATAVAGIARAGRWQSRIGPLAATETGGHQVVADGPLQGVLTPPRWRYAGQDGPFAIFTDRFSWAPLTLRALPGRLLTGARLRLLAGTAADPRAAQVSSSQGVQVIRSVSATSGWHASWRPANGRPLPLPIHRDGLVQVVSVPPGRGIVTWAYSPPGLQAGLVLSAGGAAIVTVLLLVSLKGPEREENRHWLPGRVSSSIQPR